MKITIGIILLIISLRMRSWGRKQHQIPEIFRPMYQGILFWLFFSLTGIALFITGLVVIVIGILATD